MALRTYNRALMSERLPVEVNPFRLVEQRRFLSGELNLKLLPRVKAHVLDKDADFSVTLDFVTSPTGLPMVEGKVTGQVALTCQRCLEPVDTDVNSDIAVIFTASEFDREPEKAGFELAIVNEERLDIASFIEDEILLTLPLIPKHDDCEAKYGTEFSASEIKQSTQKDNPFAALKDWIDTE